MASEAAISERVYQAIRLRVLSGELRLRERLDVSRLATQMRASATPVREALTRLASERLIEARPARGFFAVLWTRSELAELYEWRMSLAVLAAQSVKPHTHAPWSADIVYAERTTQFLRRLERNANLELKRAAANADDRLYAARRVEPEVLPGWEAELTALEATLDKDARRELVSLMRRYHARRITHAAAIRERAMLRALPGNGE